MNAILENIIQPAIRRIGTAAAVWLVAKGLPTEYVEPLVNHLAAIVLVVLDLALARFYRKSVVTRTAQALGFGGFIDPGAPFTPRSVGAEVERHRRMFPLDQEGA